jgi:uncharacterized radical SAM superfamily protein
MLPSPEAIWNLNEKELLHLLDTGVFAPLQRRVWFYAPSFTHYRTQRFKSSTNSFPTISVTGGICALGCKHCAGKVLQTMQPALSPQALFDVCAGLKRKGAVGCLVSGGCLPDGSVPLGGFASAIGRVKRELGLTVFVHTGIIGRETAVALKEAGVDAALIDVIGSEATLRKVYGLRVSVGSYDDSLEALEKAGLNVVPHVIVGLNDGKLDGELKALEMIKKIQPSALVVIAFMPIRGTAMEKTQPPKPADIAKVVATARLIFPEVPLVLGCMRPKGSVRAQTDVLALKAGADGVAFPAETAMEYASMRGFEACFSRCCCAQIFRDLTKR